MSEPLQTRSYRLGRAVPVTRHPGRIELGPALLDVSLSLRLAVADDREQLFAWHCEAFTTHIERIWGWDTDWQRNDFARLVDHVPTFVVVHDEQAIGYLQVLPRARAFFFFFFFFFSQ